MFTLEGTIIDISLTQPTNEKRQFLKILVNDGTNPLPYTCLLGDKDPQYKDLVTNDNSNEPTTPEHLKNHKIKVTIDDTRIFKPQHKDLETHFIIKDIYIGGLSEKPTLTDTFPTSPTS